MSAFSKVEVVVDVAIGSREMTLADVLKLHRGALIELERPGEAAAEMRVGNCVIGSAAIELRPGETTRITVGRLGGRRA